MFYKVNKGITYAFFLNTKTYEPSKSSYNLYIFQRRGTGTCFNENICNCWIHYIITSCFYFLKA